MDTYEIQAPKYTSGLHNTTTELARVVAFWYGWRVDEDDAIHGDGATTVAESMIELGDRMKAAGWFVTAEHSDRLVGVGWSFVPSDPVEGATVLAAADIE
ncbi:hypothetical protein ACHAAC_16205 [Aeromicrobium sp. CF4.19]|uniref:hypothetical protein n=1 Tax=Aeromicrobium sp. CF4.19 TaxID=3373082 RepID=UPI003EE774BF